MKKDDQNIEIVDEIPRGTKSITPQERILPGALDASVLDLLQKIKMNRELPHSGIELLRFFDRDESGQRVMVSPQEEAERVEIWKMFHDEGMLPRDIAIAVRRSVKHVNARIEICRMRYDEWLDENGTKLFGSTNQRLFDHIADLQKMLDEIEGDIDEAETAKEKVQLRKLKLEVMQEIAKFKAIKAPDIVFHSHSHTVAEESRLKLKELFG